MDRRAFLTGLTAAFTAPAIVRAASIMPVRTVLILPPWCPPGFLPCDGRFVPRRLYPELAAMMSEFGGCVPTISEGIAIRANATIPFRVPGVGPISLPVGHLAGFARHGAGELDMLPQRNRPWRPGVLFQNSLHSEFGPVRKLVT